MTDLWRVYIRDNRRKRVGELSSYQSLTMNLVFNDVSTWELILDATKNRAANLVFGNGIIVTRNNTTVLTGFVNETERYRRITKDGDEDTLTISGVDDTWLLDTRLAYPVTTGPPYTLQSHDVRTGIASTVMRDYVANNAAGLARIPRGYSTLDVDDDPLIGLTVTGRARFQKLIVLLQSLAVAGGGLGFRILQVGDRAKFQIYQPQDRTKSVRFSPELGTLRGYRLHHTSPSANYILVGGAEEATARIIVEGGNSSSLANHPRIEDFHDRRDIDDPTELAQALFTELEQRAEQTTLDLEPIDTEKQRYLEHYGLGDKVTVTAGDDKIQQVIRSVKLTITPDQGAVVEPTVATPGPVGKTGFFDRYKQLLGRVSNLERR